MSEATRRAVERAVIQITSKTKLLEIAYCIARFGWKPRLLLMGALAATLSAESASAQNWTGATSNDWTVGSNWSGGAVPAAGGTVNIVPGSNVVLGVSPAATGTYGTMNIRDVAGGTTSLTIQNGSTLTSTNNAFIGDVGGGSAAVMVTGTGSHWTSSTIGVGLSGTGVVDITNGATVTATRITLGNAIGTGTGTLNISNATVENRAFGISVLGTAGRLNFDNAVIRALANTPNISSGTAAQNNIAAGGLTIDNNGFTVVQSAGFSGVGGLIKTGAGSFNFGGVGNSYTGETVIQQGTLKLANAASSGNAFASSSRLVDNATFDISGMSDPSAQIQRLAGSSDGTVTMGTKGLTITNANDTFAGSFTGSGALVISGIETLTGDSAAFTGATTVQAGTLAVNGNLGGSMDVLSGGTLQGNGTVGATSVHSGGIIAPGNSIGTLHVNGAFTQAAGSTYQVQLDPASSASDLIAVNGAASLQAGSLLSASAGGPGSYTPNTVYKVLSASGGVTGTYTLAGNTAVSAFLNLVDTYDANNVYLKVVQTRDPGDAAQTGNQTSTAGGISGTGVENVVLNSQSDAAARNALDQLSGSSQASAKGAMVYDSRYTRALAIDRLRDMFCTAGHASQSGFSSKQGTGADLSGCAINPEAIAVWGQAFGSWGHSNGNLDAGRIDRSSTGFVTGIDGAVGNDWRVGVFAGYSLSKYGVDAQNASADSDDYHVGVYGGSAWGALAIRLGGAFAWHDVSSSRAVVLPGFINRLSADYNAATSQAFAEFGYQIRAGAFDLEPFLNLAYVNLHSNGFVEQGGPAALTGRSSNTDTGFTTLGMRASTDFWLGTVSATARGTLGWLHAYGDITPVSVMSFANGNPFTVTGIPIATDAAVTEAGLDLHITPHATVGVSYNGQFGGGSVDQAVRGVFTAQF